ncbi:MAG TPA: 2-C-methyl-D-erythritol 4-phosphate cytidylyltransferase, partial [Lachnospiraceae bacterium]|nr:2-C-methyl-D-erythritol 4-phosphate cytidylyltransferase [Lachnospiraceae bacterium]
RPLLSSAQITACLDAVQGHDGLMPVLPMKDTVYLSQDGARVTDLLDRSKVYAGQAPEVFRIGRYYEANQKLLPERILAINGSTEPAILDHMDIAMIPGDEGNFKITTRADLERFRGIVEKSFNRPGYARPEDYSF